MPIKKVKGNAYEKANNVSIRNRMGRSFFCLYI
jgi:hypothetical protein